jgi:hypothetical protein
METCSPITNSKGDIKAAKLTIYPGDIEEYYTFVTTEAYFALEEWKKFRIEYGEEITGDSWLVRDIWQTSNMFRIRPELRQFKKCRLTRVTYGPVHYEAECSQQITYCWILNSSTERHNSQCRWPNRSFNMKILEEHAVLNIFILILILICHCLNINVGINIFLNKFK